MLRVELGVLYIDSTDGATKPTYAVYHVRCALSLRIAELLVINMLCVVSAAYGITVMRTRGHAKYGIINKQVVIIPSSSVACTHIVLYTENLHRYKGKVQCRERVNVIILHRQMHEKN